MITGPFKSTFEKRAFLEKRPYKTMDITKLVPEKEDEAWTAKIDGAHTVIDLKKGKLPRLFSHRISKRTGNPIEYTQKLPHVKKKSPLNAVVRGETYLVDQQGNYVDGETLTSVLNSGTDKSLALQKNRNLKTQTAIIDVDEYNGKDVSKMPFSFKRKIMEALVKKDKNFVLPDLAITPQEKEYLLGSILKKEHRQTKEGLIVHSLNEQSKPFAKAKVIDDHDVYVTGIFQEQSPTGRKPMAGGFEYAWEPGGKTVGRIGTGFDHAMKEDMLKNPDKYLGRAARVNALDMSKNKVLMKPSFVDWHVEKNITEAPRSAKQTIIVSKGIAADRKAAEQIARRFADRIYTSRETSTSFRFRQKPPGQFDPTTYRTAKPQEGVSIVYGQLK